MRVTAALVRATPQVSPAAGAPGTWWGGATGFESLGGERALAGVALLFAMLTVNPVPFCVLDEVDAALDEANIGRFADALRRLAQTIDFVVITHNRATIETADTIYGVTMTDAAVSRVLSLRLADLPVEVPA
jgi:chromosome segregation protein